MVSVVKRNCEYKITVIAATPSSPNSFIIVTLNRNVVMAVEHWLTISDVPLEQLFIRTDTAMLGLQKCSSLFPSGNAPLPSVAPKELPLRKNIVPILSLMSVSPPSQTDSDIKPASYYRRRKSHHANSYRVSPPPSSRRRVGRRIKIQEYVNRLAGYFEHQFLNFLISRLLGRGDKENTDKVASTALCSSVSVGAVIIILQYCFYLSEIPTDSIATLPPLTISIRFTNFLFNKTIKSISFSFCDFLAF